MHAAQVRWRLGHRPALDGLRGVALAIVLADHAGYLAEPAGGIGVVVFFVLSGFLITRVIVEARDEGTWSMPGFVANRFVRLFPALLVVVTIVSLIMVHRGYSADYIRVRALPALAYVQNMEPYRPFAVFGQTWSLGVEEQFYLLWPLVLPWVLTRERPRLVLALAIVASAVAMMVSFHDWLPMHAYALLTGCLLALRQPVLGRWWLVPVGAVGLVGAIWLAPSFGQIYVYGPMIATPAAALLVVGAACGNRVLELWWLRFLGRVSYAIYLWHVPMLRLTGTTYDRSAALVPIAIAVLLGVASTFVIEEPLRRAWRHRHDQAVPRHHAMT